MQFYKTNFQGLIVIEPKVFSDSRGYFMESFNLNEFEKFIGEPMHFVQDNESQSSYGVLRGMHYQIGEAAQSKLVRVISGKVLDTVVDIRKDSPTFGQSFSIELSGENKKQFFIPKGFAHGFVVLSDSAIFSYKVDTPYTPSMERGFSYNSIGLNLDWRLNHSELLISDKDLILPDFKQAEYE